MNLDDVNAEALKSLETPTPPPADPTPTPAPTPPVEVPVIPPSEPPTPDPVPPAPAENVQKFKVKVRGEEIEVTQDELLSGYSRTADYTRSKQELAEYRKTAEQQAEAAIAKAEKMEQFLNDPTSVLDYAERVRAYIEKTGKLPPGVQPAASQPNGNVPATIEQARAIAREEAARIESELQRQRTQTQEEIRESHEQAKRDLALQQETQVHATEFANLFGQIFTKHPELGMIPHAEDSLRFRAFQAQPATAEEAKDLIVKFAQEDVEKLNKHYENIYKQKASVKDNLQQNNIQPPGGTAPVPAPKEYAFGSNELSDAARAYVEQASRG